MLQFQSASLTYARKGGSCGPRCSGEQQLRTTFCRASKTSPRRLTQRHERASFFRSRCVSEHIYVSLFFVQEPALQFRAHNICRCICTQIHTALSSLHQNAPLLIYCCIALMCSFNSFLTVFCCRLDRMVLDRRRLRIWSRSWPPQI